MRGCRIDRERHLIGEHPAVHGFLVALRQIREDALPDGLDGRSPVGGEPFQVAQDGGRGGAHNDHGITQGRRGQALELSALDARPSQRC
jgi:hypothetical protein